MESILGEKPPVDTVENELQMESYNGISVKANKSTTSRNVNAK